MSVEKTKKLREPLSSNEPGYERHWDRLLVRHLPSQLSAQDKEDLLKEFGATDVKMCLNNRQYRYGGSMVGR